MGWDVYDINPISKARFSNQVVDAMGGAGKVIESAKASNAKKTLEGWQWSLMRDRLSVSFIAIIS